MYVKEEGRCKDCRVGWEGGYIPWSGEDGEGVVVL